MSIKQLIFISVCFIFTFNSAFSQYNSAGTDYSSAKLKLGHKIMQLTV